ncbi:hypothetical protein BD779DRAFT_387990 [Infundibulicybe gibba]|nr:hypothetical protein BD779DRAFT_387990 [Infundibulicybe gibba]
MRSHGRGNKRNRGHKVHDDQLSSEMRLVEDGPEVYTRPHQVLHRGDNYKTPSTSNRTPYDNTREASTSRGHTETETWRRADSIPERYTYDGYRRGGRIMRYLRRGIPKLGRTDRPTIHSILAHGTIGLSAMTSAIHHRHIQILPGIHPLLARIIGLQITNIGR